MMSQDVRIYREPEPSMVRCCYCGWAVSPSHGGEDRCACPPHRGVAYEGKRFVYGIRALFVRVELALAASLLFTIGGCAAQGTSGWRSWLGVGAISLFGAVIAWISGFGAGADSNSERPQYHGVTLFLWVVSLTVLLLAACSH